MEIKKELTARSDRVKSVDLHPTEVNLKTCRQCLQYLDNNICSPNPLCRNVLFNRLSCFYTPAQPWVLSALYNGNVFIWDYTTNTLMKSFELCEVPVRCAKFITRKQWIIAATDDMHLRVYNFNTMEKVKEWEAHSDYIRFVEVHPNRPFVLSSSDDMTVKLWDWEK